MSNRLYEMKLHEEITCTEDVTIIRVPGGWIYIFLDQNTQTVFVPYNDEFTDKPTSEDKLKEILKDEDYLRLKEYVQKHFKI